MAKGKLKKTKNNHSVLSSSKNEQMVVSKQKNNLLHKIISFVRTIKISSIITTLTALIGISITIYQLWFVKPNVNLGIGDTIIDNDCVLLVCLPSSEFKNRTFYMGVIPFNIINSGNADAENVTVEFYSLKDSLNFNHFYTNLELGVKDDYRRYSDLLNEEIIRLKFDCIIQNTLTTCSETFKGYRDNNYNEFIIKSSIIHRGNRKHKVIFININTIFYESLNAFQKDLLSFWFNYEQIRNMELKELVLVFPIFKVDKNNGKKYPSASDYSVFKVIKDDFKYIVYNERGERICITRFY